MTANNAIARKLDAIRTKGAMQSVDVANLLGLRPETVSRWNQGKAFPRPGAEQTLLHWNISSTELSDFYEPADARLWLYSRRRSCSVAPVRQT